MKTLVIIPAYNEEEAILETVKNVSMFVDAQDILVVNDASFDQTEKILIENNIQHISNSRNKGLSATIRAGMRWALKNGYEAVIQIDGDGQHPAHRIPEFIQKMQETNADLVVGNRWEDGNKNTLFRKLGAWVLIVVIFMFTRKVLKDPTNGMRLVKKDAVEQILENKLLIEPSTLVFLHKKGFQIVTSKIEILERQGGKSMFAASVWKPMKYVLRQSFSIFFKYGWTRKEKRNG